MKKTVEERVGKILTDKKLTITTAESCTGGLVVSRLTDVSGSSAYVKQSFVTYANEAKIKYVNVEPSTLETFGAVSEQTVREMAQGILSNTDADVALAISGIAGPNSDDTQKPVGLVYICVGCGEKFLVKEHFAPKLERKEMKWHFSQVALEFLEGCLIANFL